MSSKKRGGNPFRSSMGPIMAGGIMAGGFAALGILGGSFVLGDLVDEAKDRAPISAQSPAEPGPDDTTTPSPNPAPPSGAPEDDEGRTEDGQPSDGTSDDDQTSPRQEQDDPGRAIGMPGKEPSGTDSAGVVFFTRQLVWGDTLWDISQATGISVERLAEYNSIENPDLIYAGDPLNIPVR